MLKGLSRNIFSYTLIERVLCSGSLSLSHSEEGLQRESLVLEDLQPTGMYEHCVMLCFHCGGAAGKLYTY